MSNPTLKRTKVIISFGTSSGYRQELTAKGGTGSKHRTTGEEVSPELALLEGIKELSRVCALFGHGDAAREAFNSAQDAVAKWREDEKKESTKGKENGAN